MSGSTIKTVFICPLNWGIGHATRCIPIIRELIRQGHKVIVGADERPMAFLKSEFSNLQFICFPGKIIRYPKKRSMALKMFFSTPSILWSIYKEHKLLKKYIKEHHIDIVVSDNRFGLWNKNIYSIFMTHQIGIQIPKRLAFLKSFVLKLNTYFIHKYDELWIPDYEEEPNLSGKLSHGYNLKVPQYFIGPLSRFENKKDKEPKDKPEILVLISGPEPQRSLFEEIVIKELKVHPQPSVILLGKTESIIYKKIDNVSIYSHLGTREIQSLIQYANIIISRPGYSTLMDLALFNKKVIFIPTPGQTEQEYLANKLKKEGIYFSMPQKEFNLNFALEQVASYEGLELKYNNEVLVNRIQKLASN